MIFVISIVGVLLALSTPALFSVNRTLALAQAGDELSEFFAYARREAIRNNRSVEVRFYDLSDDREDDQIVKALQIVQYTEKGVFEKGDAVRGDTVHYLPGGIGISRAPKLSSFFGNDPKTRDLIRGNANSALPKDPKASFIGFRFAPDGSTELPNGKWFLTVIFDLDIKKTVPENFYTIQLDPAMGKTRVYRP